MTSPLDSLDQAERERFIELTDQGVPGDEIVKKVTEEFREEFLRIFHEANSHKEQ